MLASKPGGLLRPAVRFGVLLVASATLGGRALPAQQPVDLLVHNARIFTADNVSSIRHAMVVRDGRIVATGGEELTAKYRARRTIDLAGRLVIPGFNDTHTHVNGTPAHYVELQGVRSLAEMQERLRRKAGELGADKWITGWGWSEDELAEQRKPLRADVDAMLPDNPAIIARAGGHSVVMNSRALRLAKITRDTPDPADGVIERDSTGQPTGIVRESWGMIGPLIPQGSEAELQQSLREHLKGLFELGITSITDAMTSPSGFAQWQAVYRKYGDSLPRASVQIHLPVGFGEGEKVAARIRSLPLKYGQVEGRLRVGALKFFVDGGFSGPAAWTLEHYRDQPDYYGKARLSEHDLYLVLKAANEAGWQVGMHTIGDAAIKTAVDQLARVLTERPRDDHRNFLTHFTVMPPTATMQKMADFDIWIAQQPNFTYTLEGRYVAHLVGERLQTNNPLRTPMSHGIFMAFGADIMPTGPLLGIYAAVTRRGMSGAVYGAEERLTMPEAIVAYTRNGAYFTFEEGSKGTLEAGKVADFVVMSDDLLTMDPERTRDAKVDLTVLGGQVVYQRRGAAGIR